MTWDDRFFEVEEKKAKVAAYALRELSKKQCETVSTVVEGREIVLSLVAGVQDEARLKKVQEGGQRDEHRGCRSRLGSTPCMRWLCSVSPRPA